MKASLHTFPAGVFADHRAASLQLAWLDAADDAHEAYIAWRDADRVDAALSFAAYRAALDREEAAARALEQLGAAVVRRAPTKPNERPTQHMAWEATAHDIATPRARSAEPFWPAQLAAAAALLLYLTLPHSLIMGPKWLVPGVEGILLLGLVVTTPTRHHNQSTRLRTIVVAFLGLVSLTTLISLVLLAHSLIDGIHADGHPLLLAGAELWLKNILIFGIWYWELDSGGPGHRLGRTDGAGPQTCCSRSSPSRRSRPAGGPDSSTTCTRPTRTRPRSARPTHCRSALKRSC